MFKNQTLYFIDVDSKILRTVKNPNFIPRVNELIKTDKETYSVSQVVYSLENNQYSCWVYISKIL